MQDKLEKNIAAIKRWRTRLKRAMSMLEKLEKQRRRLEKPRLIPAGVYAKLIDESVVPASTLVKAVKTAINPLSAAPDDLGIPSFLRRTPDPVAEQIKSDQEATKRQKAKGRIEKMKAKKRGDLKKMPLTGKAALDLIDNG